MEGFDVVKGFSNIAVESDISATLYHHPPFLVNADFWKNEFILLQSLDSISILPDNLGAYNYFLSAYLPHVVILKQLNIKLPWSFGYLDGDKNFDKVKNKLGKVSKSISNSKYRSWFAAIIESITDYGDPYPEHEPNRKYLLTLHQQGDSSLIYMTMSIRLYPKSRGIHHNVSNKPTVEHRHIQQCVSTLVKSALTDLKPPPTNLSVLMHRTSLRFLEKLHPEIERLEIDPLQSMYIILAKEGLVPPLDDNTKNQAAIYGVLIDGENFKKLRNVKVNVKPGVHLGYCISCKTQIATMMCSNCNEHLTCKDLKCQNKLKHECF